MATLATDKQRPYELGDLNSLPMVATDIIYEGAAVGIVAASGNARPLNAGDAFVGFCIQNADNATGSAGDVRVQVKTHGEVQLPVTNVAATDIGKPVYASDDDTFVLTATGNSYIGKVKRYVSTGVAVVAFDVRGWPIPWQPGGALTVLTDNTTGTPDDTLEALPDPSDEPNTADALRDDLVTTLLPALRNNFADLAAKVNALAAMLK